MGLGTPFFPLEAGEKLFVILGGEDGGVFNSTILCGLWIGCYCKLQAFFSFLLISCLRIGCGYFVSFYSTAFYSILDLLKAVYFISYRLLLLLPTVRFTYFLWCFLAVRSSTDCSAFHNFSPSIFFSLSLFFFSWNWGIGMTSTFSFAPEMMQHNFAKCFSWQCS